MDEAVEELIRRIAVQELVPRFRNLGADEIHRKRKGDLVTEADLAAERALTPELVALIPGSVVVGEEGSHADPTLLHNLDAHAHAWVVDPLDGTKHFARGDEIFGIMVALLAHGRTEAAWIYLPMPDRMASVRRGQGATLDGVAVRLGSPAAPEDLRGAVLTRYLPIDLKEIVEQNRGFLHPGATHHCAAQRYVDLLAGTEQFALYYRTNPWDHAAGALMIEEAGGWARRYDGSDYQPGDGGTGLLVASAPATWQWVHDRLLVG